MQSYSAFLPAAFAFFQRALAIAESRALPAADIFLLGCWVETCAGLAALIFAHRARAAAAIRARTAALILVFPRGL